MSWRCNFCGTSKDWGGDAKIALMYDDEGLLEFERVFGSKHRYPAALKDADGSDVFFACPDCVAKCGVE